MRRRLGTCRHQSGWARYLAAHGIDVGDASAQALAHHHVDFDLGHVQPAAVLGRVHEIEAIPQRLGPLGREGLVQRDGAVGVEVVLPFGCPVPTHCSHSPNRTSLVAFVPFAVLRIIELVAHEQSLNLKILAWSKL